MEMHASWLERKHRRQRNSLNPYFAPISSLILRQQAQQVSRGNTVRRCLIKSRNRERAETKSSAEVVDGCANASLHVQALRHVHARLLGPSYSLAAGYAITFAHDNIVRRSPTISTI